MTGTPGNGGGFADRLASAISRQLGADQDVPFSALTVRDDDENPHTELHLGGREASDVLLGVEPGTVAPRSPAAVRRARAAADAAGAAFFGTCNATDAFLFAPADPFDAAAADFHYLDLRDGAAEDAAAALLDAAARVDGTAQLPRQPERRRILGVLQSFHTAVRPRLRELAERAREGDSGFAERLEAWAVENDHAGLPADERLDLVARRYAFLLANRALFYEVVRGRPPDPSGDDDPGLAEMVRETPPEALEDRLSALFADLVGGVGYEPVVGLDRDLFESFPHDEATRRAVADLFAVLRERSVADAEGDLLGDLFETVLPATERSALGGYYTPPTVAETVVRWAVPEDDRAGSGETGNERVGRPDGNPGDDPVPRVLDPAAGTGTFTVAAYRRLAELYPDRSHQELLERLVSVDVDRGPLRLTSLNLAAKEPAARTEHLETHHASFFDLAPGERSPGIGRASAPEEAGPSPETAKREALEEPGGTTGGADDELGGTTGGDADELGGTTGGDANESADELGTFDAVVGNPPYVRHENLDPDAEHFRRHLAAFGPPDRTPYYDGNRRLSEKSDAYVYFLTHATRFLRDGGRLGFVVPAKWLVTDYGRSFQRFLFDHYRLAAVVGFGARAFEDALVDTVLLLAERCPDAAERAATVTKFVRLDEPADAGSILDAVEAEVALQPDEELAVRRRPERRTVARRQSDLAETGSGKLGHYLSVPAPVVRLVEHPDLIRLGDVAEVAYGNKTGANDFFFLDGEDLREIPIDERFLAPSIKSLRDADAGVVTAETTDRYLLDVHDYVTAVDRRTDSGPDGDAPLTDRVKRALRADGHDALAEYVAAGERAGYHERATCAGREVWFDLGDLERPEILHPKFFDQRIHPIWNRDRLAPSNAVDGIYLDPGIDDAVLVGILNSTVHKSILECWGRTEGGGALQLMTYEMETLPLVDPRDLSDGQRTRLKAALRRLLDGDAAAQRDLDRVVLEVLGLDLSAESLQAIHERIVRRRVRNGEDAAVPVEGPTEYDGTEAGDGVGPAGTEGGGDRGVGSGGRTDG